MLDQKIERRGIGGVKKRRQIDKYSMMAEAYRSRTYLRPLDRTLDLKSRRHTGDETLPQARERF